MEPSSRSRTLLVLLVGALPVAAGVVLLGVSLADATWLERLADAIAMDGHSDRFRRYLGDLSAIQRRAMWLGVFWAGIGALLLAPRIELGRRLLDELGALGLMVRRVGRDLRAFARSEPWVFVALAALTALTLGLEGVLANQQLRCDEAATFLNVARRSPLIIVTDYTDTNNHVLHSLAVHASLSLFGTSPWAIRSAVMLAGALLVPLAYLAVRRIADRRAALLASVAMASTYYLLDVGSNARGYPFVHLALFALLAIVSSGARVDMGRIGFAFALIAALGLWSVPTMLYPLAVVLAYVGLDILMARPPREWARPLLGLAGVAALALAGALALYSPMLLFAGRAAGAIQTHMAASHSLTPWGSVSRLWQQLWLGPEQASHRGAALVWDYWLYGWPFPLQLALVSLCVLALVLPRVVGSRVTRLAWATLLGLVLMCAVTRVVPPFWSLTYALLLLFVLAGAAAVGLLRVLLRGRERALDICTGAVATLLLAVNLHAFASRAEPTAVPWYIGYPDAPEAAQRLAEVIGPKDRVTGAPIFLPPLSYYLDLLGHGPQQNLAQPYYIESGNEAAAASELTGDVFLIRTGHEDEPRFEAFLERVGFEERDVIPLGQSSLVRYARRPTGG